MMTTGNRVIIAMIDYSKKWCEVALIPNQKAPTVATTFVDKWVVPLGVPSLLHSDMGTAFEGTRLLEVWLKLEI